MGGIDVATHHPNGPPKFAGLLHRLEAICCGNSFGSLLASDRHGSSFDRMRYDGRVGEMPVLDRWRRFADDPEFQHLVDHPSLAKLSEEICGFANPLKEVAVDS